MKRPENDLRRIYEYLIVYGRAEIVAYCDKPGMNAILKLEHE